ncbi:MAG: LacI family DNA-binding transcriptional regulator [Opitutaceae bacterium]
MKVTLRDIATRANVSATAVSQALRGTGRMSADLRKRIQLIATKMGYRVDPIISAGMAQLRRHPGKRFESILAWLNATPSPDPTQRNPVFRMVWDGARAQAENLGYKLEPFWLNSPDMSPRRLASVFRARGIEGILVLQYYHQAPLDAPPIEFDFSGFAATSVTTRLSGSDITFAQSDHFGCAMLALQEMHKLGYRRIGLICPPSIDALTQHRVLSAYHGFVSLHADMPRLSVFIDEGVNEANLLTDWLKTEKPEAVLGWKPPSEFEGLGFNIPSDLGVCMVDRVRELGECAGVDQSHHEIGAAAVRQVVSQLQQGLRGVPPLSMATMVEGSWVPGSSLQKCKQRSI